MIDQLIEIISAKLGEQVLSYRSVSGGDINNAIKVSTAQQHYFCKYNTSADHNCIISSEIDGLNLLSKHGVYTPRVTTYIHKENYSAIVMQWIDSRTLSSTAQGQAALANQLVKLHSSTSDNYGGPQENYIGSLIQPNVWYDNVYDYFYKSRLLAQFTMAYKNGYFDSFKAIEKLALKLPDIIPNEAPSLIHGDLWSGNYIIDQNHKAYLVDPSVSYGHREMDIAMLHLFGSVPILVMEKYNEKIPLTNGWRNRMDIFHMYYLLVHLNIFGRSYLDQVTRIIKKYS